MTMMMVTVVFMMVMIVVLVMMMMMVIFMSVLMHAGYHSFWHASSYSLFSLFSLHCALKLRSYT